MATTTTRKNAARGAKRGALKTVGISNRESSAEEERERQEFPPVDPDAPPQQDPGTDPPMTASRKVGGAYGRESGKPLPRDKKGSLKRGR